MKDRWRDDETLGNGEGERERWWINVLTHTHTKRAG
jgi:hypothetical protein